MTLRRTVGLCCLALCGCNDALLQATLAEEGTLDDRLALRGEICTSPPNPSGFPVKIVFLIDKSGSMCVSDGPGSQESSGFCERMGDMLAGLGVTRPGRVRALEELITRFSTQQNVSVALVPFESKISSAYPETGFVRASDGVLPDRIRALQADLGKGTDYQGALGHAYARIEADIQNSISHGQRAVLPRTKYVVILLTDGSPYPRCALDDNQPDEYYATWERPWATWRDNPEEFCNADDAAEEIPDFLSGAERNQNHQIFDGVGRLMALRDKYNLGDMRLHTILLFNREAVRMCGQICWTDLYNGLDPEQANSVSAWTLRQMAEVHGNGTFQQFTTAASIELGSLDYTSLASRFAVKTLLARNQYAFPSQEGLSVDSDGDGLPDDDDAVQRSGTNKLSVDSDGDGFPDAFEAARRGEGFEPLVADPRGCKAIGTTPAPYSCRDTDGDGLSQAAEAYLGTEEIIPDTDADGLPDGVEVMAGLDPLDRHDRIIDADLDGVPDLVEVLSHTNPLLDDREYHSNDAYRYEMVARPQADGRICYDFLASNIRLVTPDRASGQIGFNYITLTFAEAPENGVTRDYGVWRQACVFAQLAPPSVRQPAGPEITLTDADFLRIDRIEASPGQLVPTDYRTRCRGALP